MTRRNSFALLALLASIVGAPNAQPDAPMGELLKRYADGDYASVTPALSTIGDFRSALKQLDKVALPWIRAASPEDAYRRRLIAAGFGIEAAYAGLDQWDEARYFVEWGCVLLRAGGLPKPPERAWHLAAVALAQGAHDPDLLAVDPFHSTRGSRVFDHLRHSIFRFPDDDRLQLAAVATTELRTLGSDPKRPRVSTFQQGQQALLRTRYTGEPTAVEVFDREEAKRLLTVSSLTFQPVLYAARRSIWLWDLADKWKALAQRESVRTEAAIHLANTYLRLDRSDLAVEAIQSVPLSRDDASLRYLAHYLTGRARELTGDRPTAERSYRAALEAVPHAQSASIALAALLFVSDSRDDAFDLTAAMFPEPGPVPDPWRDYQANDFRLWSLRVSQLRETYRP